MDLEGIGQVPFPSPPLPPQVYNTPLNAFFKHHHNTQT